MTRAAVHPFPARMAPELAAARIATLDAGSVVLDPMMGSGTFPVSAARRGHVAYGCDTDPLAVLIAATSAGAFDREAFTSAATEVAATARSITDGDLPADEETREFIDYWFDPATRDKLARLAAAVRNAPQELHAPLWCAFSRLIITKDSGASRARDVSHSRPHRVRTVAAFDPIERFESAATTVTRRLNGDAVSDGDLTMLRSDARRLPFRDEFVDAIMTSPPYLIAIDYLRGHRMSLVWMGHRLSDLRLLRRTNVGAEVGADADAELQRVVSRSVAGELPPRGARILNRYAIDLDAVVREVARVLVAGGTSTFVLADASLAGVSVSVSALVHGLARRHGLQRKSRRTRQLVAGRRYLPPPDSGSSAFSQRMRVETVLTYVK
jgi:hypothetical protein